MNTYYLELKVIPDKANENYNIVKGAFAHCWILEDNPETACSKAIFHVSKYDWEVERIESFPVETTRNHFIDKDIGLHNYDKAQEDGIAVVFVSWSKDGKTTAGPITLKPPYNFDLDNYLKIIKQFQKNGRCLHYESGERCNEIINAHSIQKGVSLSSIAHNGYVYKLTSDIGTLRKNKGKLSYERRGIGNVSTFLGFCKKHDNELFVPIDNGSLKPTDHQIFLYGYRSLCRELFVKENAVNIIDRQLENGPNQKAIKSLLTNIRQGASFGLKNLKMHKTKYDNSLKKHHYNDIKYVLFTFMEKPFIAFSGLLYPDFDFMGKRLQDLGNHSTDLELITFCSAPMKTGWGFLFSWHNSSSKVCVDFMRSLATMIYQKRRTEDMLFRLVISSCENHAISPQWWEQLPIGHKEQITKKASKMVDILVNTSPSYLLEGLEGISNWKFESVIPKME
jgi:hypothetical protein